MFSTRLVLLEGPPGSGKSTTAGKISERIRQAGLNCRCFTEWSQDHPIPIGDDLDILRVVSTSRQREGEVLEHWRRFARQAKDGDVVTVIESRFWQTTLMLMYAAGCPPEDILASQRRVVEAIRGLAPVLIFLGIDDQRAHILRTIEIKESEWSRAGFPGTWAGHVYEALDPQPWMRGRSLSGLEGYLAFLEEWTRLSANLFSDLPFAKLEVRNPQTDWTRAMAQIHRFLGLA